MLEASKVISNHFWLFFEECPGGTDCSHWASSKAGDTGQPCKWALPGTHQHNNSLGTVLWELQPHYPPQWLPGCPFSGGVGVGLGQGEKPQSFMFSFPKWMLLRLLQAYGRSPEFWRSWFSSFLLVFLLPLMVEFSEVLILPFLLTSFFPVFKGIKFAMQVVDLYLSAWSSQTSLSFVWNIFIDNIICMQKVWFSILSPILSLIV